MRCAEEWGGRGGLGGVRSAAGRVWAGCEDRVLDRPASGGRGSKDRNWLDCIRGRGVRQVAC